MQCAQAMNGQRLAIPTLKSQHLQTKKYNALYIVSLVLQS
jgi:hypothetical protein